MKKNSTGIVIGGIILGVILLLALANKNGDVKDFCGGFAGVSCADDKICILDNVSLADSGGKCYEPADVTEQLYCQNAGGKWRQLPDACGDDCRLKGDMMCAKVLTMGCDCGYDTNDACWDSRMKRCLRYTQ